MNAEQGDEPEFLVHEDGAVFVGLDVVRQQLEALDTDERKGYRDGNAAAVAKLDSVRILVVAGPGAGKSYLFMERILHWIEGLGDRKIYVSTFVRKLVTDLRGDVHKRLTEEQQKKVDVSTLHTLARSLLERAGGTEAVPLGKHIRIIDQFWAPEIWDDVLAFHPELAGDPPSLDDLYEQLHSGVLRNDGPWPDLLATYLVLTPYYNAVGFAHLIHLAGEAAGENPDLVQHSYWVIDEYQDFNVSEDTLIRRITENADGVLVAGDDEQALYQTLKGSTPDIIIRHYNDDGIAKAMLPFCSRCDFHICNAAADFMAQHRDGRAIDKIYLPLKVEPELPKVQVVGSASPQGTIDYIRRFLEEKEADYLAYLEKRAAGEDTDPFLLILSPTGWMTFGKNSPADLELEDFVAAHAGDADIRSSAYRRVATYFVAGSDSDNYSLRRVLYFEDLTTDEIHTLIVESIEREVDLWTVVLERRPETIDRVRDVFDLVSAFDADPDGRTAELVALLQVGTPEELRDELLAHPLTSGESEREDEEAVETAGDVAPVARMSMVGSKGLSAHHVMIVGCDNLHMEKVTPLTFFVALTRARRTLHVLPSRKNGGSDSPHPFVLELAEDCCDYATYKKTGPDRREDLGGRAALLGKFETWRRGEAFGKAKAK